jgi:4-amino-4-deoxy-L-arabinose transferase-like glycosyltransferase
LTAALASRRVAVLFAVGLVCALYLADLTGMGMFGPDEPRYADVGRAMAQSGDWVTPHLWGHPWFEKPALLYWMTGIATKIGLGPDLAPRLPVALLSVLFLGFYWRRLKIEWDARAASYATAMLATSAGWLAYSHVAVTDLPLSVFFSAALLFSLPWAAGLDQNRARGRASLTAAAACLALATLAKGLVPIILFLPVPAMPVVTGDWRRLRDWLRPGPILAFCICALPWYILCTMRNGSEFLRVFFLEQQFGRFRSAALQHVQPVWFYIPVLLILLFPWFPLLVVPSVVWPADFRRDSRVRVLAGIVLFGFVFFSISVNKLYGYLLPLLPAAFALLGIGISRSKRPATAVIAPLILLSILPAISEIAPQLLAAHGVIVGIPLMRIVFWPLAAVMIAAILARWLPNQAFGAGAMLAAIGFLWFQLATFPEFDRATARPLWRAGQLQCAPAVTRDILYGIYYYAGKRVPACPVDLSGTRVVR